jgi:transposase
MTQAVRDRLVTLKKGKKRLITQGEAAEELGVTVRHVRRLLKELSERGDKAVIHGLRGKNSARRIAEEVKREEVKILSEPIYEGFGPTLASEYLGKQHGLVVSKETLRKWMKEAGLWKERRRKVEPKHAWRPWRSRCGELVQWDTSEHDWLEGRGERIYLIAMIDDATSRLYARFVCSDSTAENMRTLWGYLELYGRPAAFYTDKAGIFQTANRRKRDEPGVDKDAVEMPPTQIGRALQELQITWIPAHSPPAKGRVERGFSTAQDRLVKGLRLAGACTAHAANQYLEQELLPWWNRTLTVVPAHADDAHRPLGKRDDLAAVLCHVEQRQINNGYLVRYAAKLYQIHPTEIGPGMRKGNIRVEARLDGSLAMRFAGQYIRVQECKPVSRASDVNNREPADRSGKASKPRGKSRWMEGFWERPAPKIGKAIATANATS